MEKKRKEVKLESSYHQAWNDFDCQARIFLHTVMSQLREKRLLCLIGRGILVLLEVSS